MKKAILVIAVVAMFAGQTSAAVKYWDINGATAGAGGATPTGTWNTALTNWTTDSTGASATGVWVASDSAVFSAGGDATGAFTVTLSAAQTAAALTVEEGTVSLAGSALAIGTGTVTVESGATFAIPTISNLTQTAGSGGLVLNGGTFRQTNPGSAGSFWDADGSITVNGSGTVSYTDGTVGNLASSLYTPIGTNAIKGVGGTTANGGAGTLTKTGPDEVRYQGVGLPNTTYAKLVVNEGLFRLGFSASTADERGFGAVPLAPLADAITLTNGGAIGTSFNISTHANRGITLGTGGGAINTSAGALTIPGAITGAGNLLKNTAGTLTLSGTSDYTGNTLITAGVLIAGSSGSLGSASGNTQVSSGAELRTDLTTITTAEPISIAGTGTVANAGAINVQNSSTATFTGPITLSAAAAVGVSGTGTGTFSNAAAFTGANQNLTLNGGAGAGGGGTISGAISLGTGSLTKNNGGTWRLNNAAGNTYSGGTIISAGILQANNTSGSATGSGPVTINGGTLAGTGSVSGAVTANSGGSVSPGTSIESLDVGSLTFNDTGTNPNFVYEIDTSTVAADLLQVDAAGTLAFVGDTTLAISDLNLTPVNIAGTKFTLIAYSSAPVTGGFAGLPDDTYFTLGPNDWLINYNDTSAGVNGGTGSSFITIVTAVPEAPSFLFGGLACAAAGIGLIVRRRKASAGAAA